MAGYRVYYNYLEEDILDVDDPDVLSLPQAIYDTRTGFYVNRLKVNLGTYINYLELVWARKHYWVDLCFLDLGFIPLVMGPTFMQTSLIEIIPQKLARYGVTLAYFEARSFLKVEYSSAIDDIWISRDDAEKITGIDKFKVRTIDIINKIMEDEANGAKHE